MIPTLPLRRTWYGGWYGGWYGAWKGVQNNGKGGWYGAWYGAWKRVSQNNGKGKTRCQQVFGMKLVEVFYVFACSTAQGNGQYAVQS